MAISVLLDGYLPSATTILQPSSLAQTEASWLLPSWYTQDFWLPCTFLICTCSGNFPAVLSIAKFHVEARCGSAVLAHLYF